MGLLLYFKSGESLEKAGIKLDYFTIKEKGLKGYLKNIKLLHTFLKGNKFDLIHSHYGLCGLVTLLTFSNIPQVVSFMGDDVYGDADIRGKKRLIDYPIILSSKILQLFIDQAIVKSNDQVSDLWIKSKKKVIPNGVDTKRFKPIKKKCAKKNLNLETNSKYVLFLGDKNNLRKNFRLLANSLSLLTEPFELISPYPADHDKLIQYYNAAEFLIMTSYKEGSPNVIKEGMACNCPIVSTDVGDVSWVLGDTEGCFITTFDPGDIAGKMKLALEFADKKGRTKGRVQIHKLGLDSMSVAKKIIGIYKKILTK